MFIWTISDIIGLGFITLLAVGFGLLFAYAYAVEGYRKLKRVLTRGKS